MDLGNTSQIEGSKEADKNISKKAKMKHDEAITDSATQQSIPSTIKTESKPSDQTLANFISLY